MNIKNFLNLNFLKFLFLSLNGRINRQTWWYSQFFLVFLGVLILIPFSSLLNLLNFDKSQVEKFISFMVLLISALSIFPDSKRLQDRSINGLYAIFPYLAAIPLQFHFVPEFLLKIQGSHGDFRINSPLLMDSTSALDIENIPNRLLIIG